MFHGTRSKAHGCEARSRRVFTRVCASAATAHVQAERGRSQKAPPSPHAPRRRNRVCLTASASPRLPDRVCLPRQQLVSAVEPDGDGTLQPPPRHPASLAQRRPRGPRRPRLPLRGHAALCGCAPVRPFCSPWASGLFLGRNLSQMFPSVSGGRAAWKWTGRVVAWAPCVHS